MTDDPSPATAEGRPRDDDPDPTDDGVRSEHPDLTAGDVDLTATGVGLEAAGVDPTGRPGPGEPDVDPEDLGPCLPCVVMTALLASLLVGGAAWLLLGAL